MNREIKFRACSKTGKKMCKVRSIKLDDILKTLWEAAYSGGLREHRKDIDIEQAKSDIIKWIEKEVIPKEKK